MNLEQKGLPFVFSAPVLQAVESDRVLKECPTGFMMREAPWVFDAIDRAACYEQMGPTEFGRLSQFMQHAIRIYSSERARLIDLKARQEQARSDAKYASRMVANG